VGPKCRQDWQTLAAALILPIVSLPASGQIRRLETFREDATVADWRRGNNELLYIARSPGGRREVFRTRPSGPPDCVTCSAQLPLADRTAAVWEPSGRLIVLACERGLWSLDLASRQTRGLREAQAEPRDLRFSRDGSELAWSENGPMVARFHADHQTLSQVRLVSLSPEIHFTALDDFMPGGDQLLLTAFAGDPRTTEIYSCEMARPECRKVTNKPGQRNEFARLTPSGKRIVFASTEGGWLAPDTRDLKSDLWLLSLDGSGTPQRFTWLNDPADPRYVQNGARVTESAWGWDGRWLAATVVLNGRTNRRRIVKIEFPDLE